jgi:hypothetical protein
LRKSTNFLCSNIVSCESCVPILSVVNLTCDMMMRCMHASTFEWWELSTVSSSLLAQQIHLHRLLLAPSWPEKTRDRHCVLIRWMLWVLCKPTYLLTYLLSSILKDRSRKNEDKKGGIFYILVIYILWRRNRRKKKFVSLFSHNVVESFLPAPGTSECRTFQGNVGSRVYQAWIHISRSYRHVTASIDARRRSSMYTFSQPIIQLAFVNIDKPENQPTC